MKGVCMGLYQDLRQEVLRWFCFLGINVNSYFLQGPIIFMSYSIVPRLKGPSLHIFLAWFSSNFVFHEYIYTLGEVSIRALGFYSEIFGCEGPISTLIDSWAQRLLTLPFS